MTDLSTSNASQADELRNHWKPDIVSGFLVFLIALPLCLGIAAASGYPPIAGIWTAVIGGILTTFISNSEMTIKGPAAGLIVIALGAITDFRAELIANGMSEDQAAAMAYRMALGIGIVAGCIQIAFGLLRAGVLADFFPLSAVHGMLASIGIIIMFKQAYPMIGTKAPGGKAIDSVLQFPESIPHAIPNIAIIGVISLIILFGFAFITNKHIKKIPAQVFVLLFAIPMGYILTVDSKFLVAIPDVMGNPESAFARPNFDGVLTKTGVTYIILYAMIGSVESLLSAKAIDLIDPYKRKTNLNRDILAVGVGNTCSAAIGGLPMISEIVRSAANVNNGARTRFADLFHGLFLLVAVLLLGPAIQRIPLAALGAMLVYTGFRLAHPKEFHKTFTIGLEQLVIFLTTIVAVLMTDLLIGIAAGVAMKLLILAVHGVSPLALFRCETTIDQRSDGAVVVQMHGPLVFSNWIRLKSRVVAADSAHVVLDVSDAHYIDHTCMERLHELEVDFHNSERKLEVVGIDSLRPLANHKHSSRKRKAA